MSLLAASSLLAQSSNLSGTIVSRETREPLAYAIVGIKGLDRGQFANDSGTFFFGDVPFMSVTLHVRRLGYQPFDTTLALPRGTTTRLRIELARVAVQLNEVEVKSFPPCLKPGPPPKADTALTAVFNQMRMNAEQYEFLTTRHPLHYLLDIEQSTRLKADGSIRLDSTEQRRIDAMPKWRYRPGRLIVPQGFGFFVHLPMLVDFATKSFIQNHCFTYAGLGQIDQDTVVRMHVVAAQSLRTRDVSGTLYLDPRTFQIRRTVLQLTMPLGALGSLQDFEMTSDFREILPGISILDRVHAIQRIRSGTLDYDEAYEIQRLQGYQFLKTRPGERPR